MDGVVISSSSPPVPLTLSKSHILPFRLTRLELTLLPFHLLHRLPANAAYNASKAAAVSLHASLSSELHAYHKVDNVRSSVICPLKIESKMTEGRMLDTHDQFLLPTLTIPEAASKIVDILEGDKSRVVYIPRAMYVLSLTKVLPLWSVRLVGKMTGSMDTFLTYAKEFRNNEDNLYQK